MFRSSATSFYNADGLGTVTSLANTAGALAQTYTFDSFGNQTASSGSLTNPFQYTARENDPETGLYYYRARYYDSASGRFLREDPVGFMGGENFYAYVYNQSTNFSDPSGLQKYKCNIFGVCSKIPFGPGLFSKPSNSSNAPCGCIDPLQFETAINDAADGMMQNMFLPFKRALAVGIEGGVIGCFVTSEAGCFEGAIPGAATGALGGAIEGAGEQVYRNVKILLKVRKLPPPCDR